MLRKQKYQSCNIKVIVQTQFMEIDTADVTTLVFIQVIVIKNRRERKYRRGHRRYQSLAISPLVIDLVSALSLVSPSFTSNSHALGGTSTAGEQLKNPCGCTHRHPKLC